MSLFIYQKIIKREDLKANPHFCYVFGDNILRKGFGGQAKEMRGEPNAIGIITKVKPTMDEDAFLSDNEHEDMISYHLGEVEEQMLLYRCVVWPLDGIGTGLAQLPTRAPKIYERIKTFENYYRTKWR